MSSKLNTLLKEKLDINKENIKKIKLKTVKDYLNNNKKNENDIYLGYLQLNKNNGVIVLKGPQGPPGKKGMDAICPASSNTSDLGQKSKNLFRNIDRDNISRSDSLFPTPNFPFPGFSNKARINEDLKRKDLYDNFGLGGKKTKKSNKSKKIKNKKSKKTKILKGGAISPLPKNPTPSSYYPAPNNPLPKPPCKLPHFRPYLLNQKGI